MKFRYVNVIVSSTCHGSLSIIAIIDPLQSIYGSVQLNTRSGGKIQSSKPRTLLQVSDY